MEGKKSMVDAGDLTGCSGYKTKSLLFIKSTMIVSGFAGQRDNLGKK